MPGALWRSVVNRLRSDQLIPRRACMYVIGRELVVVNSLLRMLPV